MMDPRSTKAYKLEKENRELKKEIEKLNNIIEEYKNANEYHQNIIHELGTMKAPNQLYGENVRLRAENNRLNNIISELERILQLEVLKTRENSEYNKGLTNAFNYAIHMISELKGSNEPSFEEMVEFVENVYQDIKNQSTLDEELKEERERIAKIVDDFKGADKE